MPGRETGPSAVYDIEGEGAAKEGDADMHSGRSIPSPSRSQVSVR